MLRLAPSHPPLWRTPSSLQLGTDQAVRVDDVTGWQERLLDALTDGIPDAMLVPLARTMGADGDDAERFAARIGGALITDDASAPVVRLEVPESLGVAGHEALEAGWRAAGVHVASLTRWESAPPPSRLPVVVVAERMLDPRRAARLMAADIVHLPIELAGDRVRVGPLVVPGRTACLACVHAHRTDADPTWPLLAAQLLGREPTHTDPALLVEAAVLGARMLRGIAVADAAGVSVTISSDDVRRMWHAHRPHPACLCRTVEDPPLDPPADGDHRSRSAPDRSPAESESAGAAAPPIAPTSSATACAQPA
ncbi:bacteriocin biosynthesis cyclodehydratase domain-containing protein [Microbacterium aurum]|nr:bacteriocin biosynthesis cyclodehydratase domain-containing protein [Microbacterium aurum]